MQKVANLEDALEQYQDFTPTTAVYPREQGVTYLTLGLNGEAGEVAQKILDGKRDLEKELGDVLWYVVQLCNEIDVSVTDVVDFTATPSRATEASTQYIVVDLFQTCAAVAEGQKKSIRDDAPFDTASALVGVLNNWIKLTRTLGYDVGDVLETNVEKLTDRQARDVLHGEGDDR